MKYSSIFVRGFRVCTFKVHRNTRIIFFFSFDFETASTDNYGEPVISHLTTARQIC